MAIKLKFQIKMDEFLERHKPAMITHEKIENLNSLISINK